MSAEAIVLFGAVAVLVVTAVSGRLDRAGLTEPLLVTAIGVGAGIWVIGPVDMDSPLILLLLELTLALVLFSDASRIDMSRLRDGYSWPLRMLVIGLPVGILVGTVLFGWILGVSLGVALLVGVILAPTDAALAEPVLVSEVVPLAIGISLVGQRLNTRTVAFLGWFGPRGLATIVFLLVAAQQLNSIDQIVIDTVTLTVLTSVVAHGISAYPMSRWLAGMGFTDDMPEMGEAFAHPMRR